jgi:dCMP deaminase
MINKPIKIHDWNKLSKSKLSRLKSAQAVFIAGSRDMSPERISQLAQGIGSQTAIIWGCLKDQYIEGLEGSLQFKSLQCKKLAAALAGAKVKHSVTILQYYQRDWRYLIRELNFSNTVLVNGSWHRMLHLRPEFWEMERRGISIKRISPFTGEKEAKAYAVKILGEYDDENQLFTGSDYSDSELMRLSTEVAKRSFDWVWQIGAVLARDGKPLLAGYNRVVPYESASMHHGSTREENFSPPNDQNHYDTCHAEMDLLIQAQRQNVDLKGTKLYINLLPCPACARVLARTDISEIVYENDHSEGYGFRLLSKAGKQLTRV